MESELLEELKYGYGLEGVHCNIDAQDADTDEPGLVLVEFDKLPIPITAAALALRIESAMLWLQHLNRLLSIETEVSETIAVAFTRPSAPLYGTSTAAQKSLEDLLKSLKVFFRALRRIKASPTSQPIMRELLALWLDNEENESKASLESIKRGGQFGYGDWAQWGAKSRRKFEAWQSSGRASRKMKKVVSSTGVSSSVCVPFSVVGR